MHNGLETPPAVPMAYSESQVCEAARIWWAARRPSNWTLDEHLASPTHRCIGDHEKRLARAVAANVADRERTAGEVAMGIRNA